MTFRTTRAKLAAGVVSTVAVGALAMSATPAPAHTGHGAVDGYGYYKDDFIDEGTVSPWSYRYTNAAMLWQKILWAEGARESNGTNYDYSDIDCNFGPNTYYATKNLQGRWGLYQDGKVGPKTFGKAGYKLQYVSYNSSSYRYRYTFKYSGALASFYVYRSADGKYTVYTPGVGWRYAAYTYKSCA